MAETDLSSVYSCETQEGNTAQTDSTGETIRLKNNLLSHQTRDRQWVENRTSTEWIEKVFKESAIYEGFDELLWGNFFICVYKDPATDKLSSIVIDKLGVTHFNPVTISGESQYYPAIENLDPKDRESNVRKCIAVSLLQKFAQVTERDLKLIHPEGLKFDYDPTHAGDLASSCKLVEFGTPENVGRTIISLGFLQRRCVHASLFDVVYEQKPSATQSNNRIVFHLGEQLEQLFDPLSEYSPEQTEYTYKSPEGAEGAEQDDPETRSIINELFQLQTTFTLNLVEFLQSFLIALRVKVLNDEISGLSTVKLNRLFPPTIDEVTRINCIFLDSLKSAVPYGSLEVLKACSLTIPYFYKAYTRHEAATKNFNKDIKLFLRRFSDEIPQKDIYSEMKIETIVRGPQEKLLKIKLIIDRLFTTKKWTSEELSQAREYYKSIAETIDAFGKLEAPLSSYSTRVFTPSGKILTELAKGWPVELQYKWLRRRVVGVFDIVEEKNQGKRMLLVIFSDYVVFLDINRGDIYYKGNGRNRPQIADVLMNSLINEVPLPPKIPKLTVAKYCFIDDLLVSSLENGALRFDSFKQNNAFSVVFRLASETISNSTVAELVIKAKILEKETAFHLFRASHDDITVYLTAHELEAYQNENVKSKFAIFLNMDPSTDLLQQFKLQSAVFLNFTSDTSQKLQADVLTSDGRNRSSIASPEDLIHHLIKELTVEMPICFSSVKSPIMAELLKANENLISRIAIDSQYDKSEDTMTEGKVDSSFNAEHAKKKSFGTITTYRSHISDLKVVSSEKPSENATVRHDNTSTAIQVTRGSNKATKQRQQPQKVNNKPLTDRSNKSNKRRNFVSAVLGLFGAKGRSAGKMSSRKDRNKKTISHPVKDQQKSIDVVSAPKSDIDYRKRQPMSSQRMTSVIRKPGNHLQKSSAASPKIDHEKLAQQSFSEAHSSRESQGHPYELFDTPHAEMSPCSTSTHSNLEQNSHKDHAHITTSSTSSTGLYKQAGRQSQLFDDDLFGDLIPSRSDTEANNENKLPGSSKLYLNEKDSGDGNFTSQEANTNKSEDSMKEHSQAAGHLSKFEICSSSSKEKAVDAKSKRESVTPTSAPGTNLEIQQANGAAHQSIFEPVIPTHSQSKVEPKERIFPSIPVMKPSKIDFERSSSFIELFEGMRLVLDESDAQYNWKCLSKDPPSTRSADSKGYTPHAFKSIAVMNNSNPFINSDEPPARQTIVNHSSNITLSDMSSNIDDKAITTEGPVADARDERSLERNPVSEIKPVKTIPAFRVVKASPTRIVKRVPGALETEGTEHSLRCNFSISSDLHRAGDERWFEVRLPSEDDFEADAFDTPIKEHSSKVAEEQQNDSVTSSPFKSNDSMNETPDESIPSDRNELQKKDPVIEDFDFSSFHVTFDSVGGRQDGSPSTSSDSEHDLDQHPSRDRGASVYQQEQEPLYYHLPAYPLQDKPHSFTTGGSGNLTLPQASIEDDPIWISPSKLDFYDLSNVETVTHSRNFKTTSNDNDRHGESSVVTERDGHDKNSLRELSYAYLASYLSPRQSHRDDDGPERLQFKE